MPIFELRPLLQAISDQNWGDCFGTRRSRVLLLHLQLEIPAHDVQRKGFQYVNAA